MKNLNKGDRIKADLYSRPNYMSGRYKAAKIVGLENFEKIKSSDVFFLETLQVRANSADRIFDEAKAKGRDLNNASVLSELSKEINSLGTPIHGSEAITAAIWCVAQVIVLYALVVGVWGVVFEKSFFIFCSYGGAAGFLISILFIFPVIAFQRTMQRVQDTVFGASSLWVMPMVIIGILGLVAWILRAIFLN
jgi:hypothetical protein